MDWLPTLLAAAGIRPAPSYPTDGLDITKALGGARLPQRTLFWRYRAHAQQACRRGDWKYLKIDANKFLFNVSQDPLERANLKNREPARFAALERAWQSWDSSTHDMKSRPVDRLHERPCCRGMPQSGSERPTHESESARNWCSGSFSFAIDRTTSRRLKTCSCTVACLDLTTAPIGQGLDAGS